MGVRHMFCAKYLCSKNDYETVKTGNTPLAVFNNTEDGTYKEFSSPAVVYIVKTRCPVL